MIVNISSACAHGDHKTAATIYDNVINRLFGIGHVTVGIFVIGNESIVQTKVDFYCAQWRVAFESGGIGTLHFMTNRDWYKQRSVVAV
jgi:hypothetical protein